MSTVDDAGRDAPPGERQRHVDVDEMDTVAGGLEVTDEIERSGTVVPHDASAAIECVLRMWQVRNTLVRMKTLTVRLPIPLVTEIEAESRARRISKSDVVRERLRHVPPQANHTTIDPLAAIVDLIGAAEGLPHDLSAHTKRHLRASGYGRKRPR